MTRVWKLPAGNNIAYIKTQFPKVLQGLRNVGSTSNLAEDSARLTKLFVCLQSFVPSSHALHAAHVFSRCRRWYAEATAPGLCVPLCSENWRSVSQYPCMGRLQARLSSVPQWVSTFENLCFPS